MPMYSPDPSIKGSSFDDILKNRGVRFVHAKATPCPNILTLDSNAHEPNCTFCDNNGFMHYDPKDIWGMFTGNSIQKTFEAHGVWEIGTAVVTLPTEYPDGTQADFNAFDKLTIPDFTVRLWELKEYEPRPGNIQQLRYPIVNVDRVSSILQAGSVQKIYTQGVNFNINAQGDIVWIDGMQPAYNPQTGHGEVLTWSFYANPVYLVVQTLRELRVTQELVNGQKVATRLPQQILVRRDFLPTAAETLVKP
ncbi:unnamed protein product [Sphagnum jensenii]